MIRFLAKGCMPLVFSLLLAACAAGTPGAPQGSGQTAAPGGPPVKPGNDACALLTDAEITQVTGFTVLSKAPAVPFGGTGGCQGRSTVAPKG